MRVHTQALLYFIHVMDHITVKEYVMVYFHTLTAEHNHLTSDFLKNLHDIVDYKSVQCLSSLSLLPLFSLSSLSPLPPLFFFSSLSMLFLLCYHLICFDLF